MHRMIDLNEGVYVIISFGFVNTRVLHISEYLNDFDGYRSTE